MKTLIKLKNHFYVVDFGRRFYGILKDTYYYSSKDKNVYKFGNDYDDLTETDFQITHSTRPLEGVQQLNPFDVEDTVYGYSARDMAKMSSWDVGNGSGYDGYIKGFRDHQMLVYDKSFTIDDMRDCWMSAILSVSGMGDNPNILKITDFYEFIKPHLPITEWEIQIDENNKITLL
jgi:hypothetical protein